MTASKERWFPSGAATLVGSLPHRDRQKALDLIFQHVVEIPVWPQLSSYLPEQMMIQFNQGLPGLVRKKDRDFFVTSDPGFQQELLAFYEEYLAVSNGELSLDRSRFRLRGDTGQTFFAFLNMLERQQPRPAAVKGQTTGPFTLLAGLKDENDKLALYDPRLRDVVVKTLALKAEWQVERLNRFSLPCIIFIDEPALAGFGSSAFISIAGEDVIAMLDEITHHIHKAGGLAGTHVCANTDWSLFFKSSMDVINLDAYTYFDRFALYRGDLIRYLNRDGLVAWGIVPTMEADIINEENASSLVNRWKIQTEQLIGPDLSEETIFRRTIITPSCGCGSLSEPLAEKVVHLTRQVSEQIRHESPV